MARSGVYRRAFVSLDTTEDGKRPNQKGLAFMANIKSQKKRIITNEKRRMRNRAVKSELKTAVRHVKDAVAEGNGKDAYAFACEACRLMDKAASKGVIHKNQAANRKSGIMRLANTVVTAEDIAAYEKPAPKPQKTGSKKAEAKAARKAAMAAASAEVDAAPADARPLRIAVPKGSLNAEAIACLEEAGLDVTGLANPGRALVISNPGVDYIIVRPSDAPVFVALGAADCGICGKDSLLEVGAAVEELVDLRFGGCRFVVAESAGTSAAIEERYRKLGSIRIATKYPSITRAHFARTGTQVEIVYLHGNIELGPIVGMADRIVDITATGTTLRENDLVVVDDVMECTARVFAGPAAYRCDKRIRDLAARLAEVASKEA